MPCCVGVTSIQPPSSSANVKKYCVPFTSNCKSNLPLYVKKGRPSAPQPITQWFVVISCPRRPRTRRRSRPRPSSAVRLQSRSPKDQGQRSHRALRPAEPPPYTLLPPVCAKPSVDGPAHPASPWRQYLPEPFSRRQVHSPHRHA